MKRIFVIFSSLFLAAILVGAAEDTPFEGLTIGILPEYDHPGVLVLYNGSVKESELPLHLEISVPSEIQYAVGVGQTDTTEKWLPLDVVEREDGNWIVSNIIKKEFQIKFYFNPFTDKPERKIDFPIKLNQNVQGFHVAVQQPLSSEKFVFMEPDAETVTDDHGMTYFRIHVPELKAGDTKVISLSYLNPSGKLSINILQEMLGRTSGMGAEPAAGRTQSVSRYQLPTYEPLLVLGILSVIIGYLFWRHNRSTAAQVPSGDNQRFCTHCGNRINPGDRFCSQCGTKTE